MHIQHELADIWIADDGQQQTAYAYGGTRTVPADTSDADAIALLHHLLTSESLVKNRLIDLALREGALGRLSAQTPAGFATSSVGGARCVIRPRDNTTAAILADPSRPDFGDFAAAIFAATGAALNRIGGRVLLTPDFGRYAGLADLLLQHTPFVLGIRCERGGCGGKSSYSATGVLAVLDALRPDWGQPVTLIGAAGALGSAVLSGLAPRGATDLAVADIAYEGGAEPAPPAYARLPARFGAFSEPCLRRGGLLIATTVGHELERSAWELLPAGSTLALAHNLALPPGEQGLALAAHLLAHGVHVLPGQLLTLGGALTARLEWFARQADPDSPFDKELAHTVVYQVSAWLADAVAREAAASGATPLATLSRMAGLAQ